MNRPRPLYAGIGSRNTPAPVLERMRAIALQMAIEGWTLSTGAAHGADSAFAEGAGRASSLLYLPWNGYNGLTSSDQNCLVMSEIQQTACAEVIARHHPAWHRCRRGARALHARNAAIILGPDRKLPVNAVIFWCPRFGDGRLSGGTATGVNLARSRSIPTFHLADYNDRVLFARLRDIAREAQEAPTHAVRTR